MTQIIRYFAIPVMLLGMVLSFSCTKTKNNAYKDYMTGGELTYPGRADSIIVRPGYKRTQLAVVLGSDPLVKKVRVFWNNGADSADADVAHTTGADTVTLMLTNLPEGNYNFVAYTFDADGHRSVACYGSGIVYGDSYTSSLSNRTLLAVMQTEDGSKITLAWGTASEGDLGTKVHYLAADGTDREIVVTTGTTRTEITDYKGNSTLSYQSSFKPDPLAIENFSPASSAVTLHAIGRKLNKSNFALRMLPTDVDEGGYGWLQSMLWDENYNPPGFATQDQVPCWFTIDAGESVSLSRVKIWQANDRLYEKESVRTFELYGSDNPNPDGSWDSWTLIGSYTSVKPSATGVGSNTPLDVDYATTGEDFFAPAGTPKARYYRFKLLSNWGNSSFMTMEEVSFYTND